MFSPTFGEPWTKRRNYAYESFYNFVILNNLIISFLKDIKQTGQTSKA